MSPPNRLRLGWSELSSANTKVPGDAAEGANLEKFTFENQPAGFTRMSNAPPARGAKSTGMGETMRCLQMGWLPGSAGLLAAIARFWPMVTLA